MTTTTDTSAEGIGDVLRQTREQKGLSVQNVATSLNLKATVIEHIEAERWDLLGVNPTFIRGYLRAYARYLKLPERELLQAFELQAAFMRQHEQAMHSFSNRTSRVAAERRFMWASYFLGVLLIGLFLVSFWQTHLLDSKPFGLTSELSVAETATASVSSTGQTAAVPSDADRVSTAQTVANASGTVTPSATTIHTSTANTSTANTSTTDTSANNTSTNNTSTNSASVPSATTLSPVTNPATSANTAASHNNATHATDAAVAASTDVATTVAATNAEQETGNTTAPSAAVGERENSAPMVNHASVSDEEPQMSATKAVSLTLSFTDDCWLEIYDAKQQRMAYGMQKAGQQLQLSGTGPLNLKIGNAAATTLTVNNKAYDLSGFSKGRVARLTLTGTE